MKDEYAEFRIFTKPPVIGRIDATLARNSCKTLFLSLEDPIGQFRTVQSDLLESRGGD